jgi:hypothetical protein
MPNKAFVSLRTNEIITEPQWFNFALDTLRENEYEMEFWITEYHKGGYIRDLTEENLLYFISNNPKEFVEDFYSGDYLLVTVHDGYIVIK